MPAAPPSTLRCHCSPSRQHPRAVDLVGPPRMVVVQNATTSTPVEQQLEQYRVELTAYCYRMLGLRRGGGRRAGDVHSGLARVRPLRGPRRVSLVALSDRDERLLRHARQPEAPGAPDGPRPGGRTDRREPAHARPALDRADARRARGARGRSGRGRHRTGVGSACLRRSVATAPAAPARGPDPL